MLRPRTPVLQLLEHLTPTISPPLIQLATHQVLLQLDLIMLLPRTPVLQLLEHLIPTISPPLIQLPTHQVLLQLDLIMLLPRTPVLQLLEHLIPTISPPLIQLATLQVLLLKVPSNLNLLKTTFAQKIEKNSDSFLGDQITGY